MEKTPFLTNSEHETPRFLIEKRGSKTFSKGEECMQNNSWDAQIYTYLHINQF
jgi:hypothetical protein